MGGVGSGWFEHRSRRMRTDNYPSIDVRGMTRTARRGAHVVLAGSGLAVLEWKPCHFGGHRPYFKCPRCTGRCCILYKFRTDVREANNYGCQKCLNMVHPVENEGKLERSLRRNNKAINRRIYDPTRPEGKPLWMRWRTWNRLSDQFKVDVMTYFEDHEKILMGIKR